MIVAGDRHAFAGSDAEVVDGTWVTSWWLGFITVVIVSSRNALRCASAHVIGLSRSARLNDLTLVVSAVWNTLRSAYAVVVGAARDADFRSHIVAEVVFGSLNAVISASAVIVLGCC